MDFDGNIKNSSSLIEKIQYFYLKSSIYNGISEGSLDEKKWSIPDSRLSETKRRGSEQ